MCIRDSNLENSISLHVITLSNHGEAIIQFRTNLEHFSSCYFKIFFNHGEVIIQFRSNLLCLSWSFLKIFFSHGEAILQFLLNLEHSSSLYFIIFFNHGEEIIQFQSSLEYWSIWAAYTGWSKTRTPLPGRNEMCILKTDNGTFKCNLFKNYLENFILWNPLHKMLEQF